MSSVKQYRSFLACLLTWILTLCQLVPVSGVVAKPGRPPDTTTSSKNELPSAIPAPAPFTVNITATNFDNYPNAPGPAQPGDTITYNITITNNGNTDATAVTFTDLIDPNTTLVPGSLQTQPMATPDSYNVIGNVRIQPDAANGLLANDSDPDTGNNSGLTAAGPTFSAQGGNVVVNADGSFSYNPNPGFSGHDEFTYTVTDSSGKTDSARVDLNVGLGDDSRSSIAIWFINAAAPAGGDGRLTSPFNCYTGTNSPTQTCFSSSAAQEPGDVIFLYTGNYTGGSTLLDRQILMGQGSSNNVGTIASLAFPIGSDPLPDTHGVSPTITTTNPNTNGINLGVGNNLRGFTVGNTTGAKISGSNFGSLQLGFRTQPDVILTGSGQALNLTNGSFQTTSAFASVTTTSSASQGISLSGIQGTVSLGSTTISGNSSDCILVQSSSADINFGNTTCTGGGNGVHFEANPSGTRIFGTLSVSGVSANAFLHLFNGVTGVGGGNVTITGAANLSSVGDTILVNDPGNTPLIDFQAATSLTSTGTSESADGIDWFSKGTLKFNALSIQSSSGIGIHAQGAGTINVTNNTGSINARQAIEGISIALSANFASTTSSGGPYGIHLNHVTGTSDFGGGSLNGSGSGPAIWIDGGTANLTYGGNMSQTNNKPLLNVTGGHTGTLTFNSGTLSATNGTGLQFDNADGSYNFNGVTTLNGGDAGIDILNDSAGTFNFGPGASITNPFGHAFNVDGNAGGQMTTSTATVIYSGNITTTSSTNIQPGAMVRVWNHAINTITFQTGTLNSIVSDGLVFFQADGTYNFNGTTTLGGTATQGNGIQVLNGSDGTFNFNNTTVTDPAGFALLVSALSPDTVTGNISISGALSKTRVGGFGGELIQIGNYDKGTINISGPLTCTGECAGMTIGNDDNGAGSVINFSGPTKTFNINTRFDNHSFRFQGNAGTTINFIGGNLNLDTTNRTAVTIKRGGTINVLGPNNTIKATNGTALDMEDANIGSGGMNFKSISSTGDIGSDLRINTGIILSNTGTLGGLHVTGDGAPGTGGTIATKTGANGSTTNGVGIYLNNTSDTQLAWMQLNDLPNFAIQASEAHGLSLQNSVISGLNGDDSESEEGSIFMANCSGNISIAGSNISGGLSDNLRILYDSATADTAVYNITGTTFQHPQANATSLVNLRSATTASTSSNVTFNFGNPTDPLLANTFDNSANQNPLPPPAAQWSGRGILVNFEGPFQHTLNVDKNNFSKLFQALGLNSNFSTHADYRIYDNNITFTEDDAAIALRTGTSSTASSLVQALIEDNDIGNGTVDSGSRLGFGIAEFLGGEEIARVTVHQNIIKNTELSGLLVFGQAGDGDLHQRITNNTIARPDNFSAVTPGINLTTNNPGSHDIFLDIRGNDVTGNIAQDIWLRQASLNNTFSIEDLPGPAPVTVDTQVESFIATQNPGNTVDVRTGSSVVNYTTMNLNNTDTPPPLTPLLSLKGSVSEARAKFPINAGDLRSEHQSPMIYNSESAPPRGSGQFPISQSVPPRGSGWVMAVGCTAAFRLPGQALAVSNYAPTNHWLKSNPQQSKKPTIKLPKPEPIKPLANLGPISIGTLRAGDSVTITFKVTVNNPYLGGPTVSNQGTVSGSNFTSVLTDDISFPGPADPTLTPVTVTRNLRVSDAQANEPATGSTTMLFTVSLSAPAGAAGASVHYSTADQSPGLGHAVAGTDYTAVPDTVLNFATGEQFKVVAVNILADTDAAEPDETFLLNLSNPVGANLTDGQAVGTIKQGNAAGTFLISELRTSGPGGPGDAFFEFYNNTDAPLTVAASDASAGYGLFKRGAGCVGTPVLIGTIPNGTIIPAHGHYLMVGPNYSLGALASGDLTFTVNPEADVNVGIFNTSDVANLSTTTRLDAVGFGNNLGGVCDLLREGTNLPALGDANLQSSFQRDQCGKGGNPNAAGNCPSNGMPVDTNNNNNDFLLVDTAATVTPAGQRLGAPGPENLSSPIVRNGISATPVDPLVPVTSPPNRVRDVTSDPAHNATLGTLSIRRTITNNSGAPITRLRFRIIDISSFPSGGIADVRALTSSNVMATLTGGSTVEIVGTTLEAPEQTLGGALNSTLGVGTITLATPLPSGASVNVQFLLGVQQGGVFKFYLNVEALP